MGAERGSFSEEVLETAEKIEIAAAIIGGGIAFFFKSKAGLLVMFGSAIAYAATRQFHKKS